MIVLVTGGRAYANREALFRVLDRIHRCKPITTLLHGQARGADTLAGEWAKERGVLVRAFPANWKEHGRLAGVKRNAEMVAFKPDLVVAFPGGRGTANCVGLAKKRKLKIIVVKDGSEGDDECTSGLLA